MLIGDSTPEYAFIRTAIFGLRLIAPASVLYCSIFPAIDAQAVFRRPFPLPLSIWMIAEIVFFIPVYFPLKFWLQQKAVHPEPPAKEDRKILLEKCLETIDDLDRYLSKWFFNAPVTEIKRENLREFYAWSFMNKENLGDLDDDESAELDTYIDRIEEKFGRKFPGARGKARSLRGTVEDVPIQHRPLIWYLAIGLVDCLSSARLIWSGFSFYPSKPFTTFPIRPLSLLGSRNNQPEKLPYWYRKHTSKTRLPVLCIHGIGVGLFTYVDFLAEINSTREGDSDDGDIGIIAVEILPISARICTQALSTAEMLSELRKILDMHAWNEFVLVGHSYGTAISATILREPELSKRAKAAVLMDPICFLLHFPDVAYNFTRRPPSSASEHELHYFSSRDMMISHTIGRRFFWSEYILWKDEVKTLPMTVTLSGRDIIVPTNAVWEYLTDKSPRDQTVQLSDTNQGENRIVRQRDAEWKNDMHEVFWFDDLNHAGLFTSKGARRGVIKTIRRYCKTSLQ